MDAAALQAAGWVSREAQGYTGFIAPLWMRGAAGVDRTIGFITDARHANYHGTVHGGALMNFADIALGWIAADALGATNRSDEHTSELQSLMRISYAVL